MTPFQPHNPYDWNLLLGLIQRAFSGMEGRIDPPSSINRMSVDDLEHHPGEVWVIGQPPLACVLLTPKGPALHIGKLSVDPAHQGEGYAGELIRLAETRARALGLSRLELQSRVELVENHAIFFALGFQQTMTTSHPGYDHPTSLVFTRPV
ncbi:GNAT family N-acetyltransferase [Szabonella alba]|uniref:GNAT family N-acetyltransferase n=1 Tax=Szabonella alba TaxID=2804194 RepID=A0A8K0VD86_9RHOB|nr:GNAT family N-acetyltransferase [Szabonella alba]MBL4918043.1 GNAT family N-acetyltransferase [Szabonella alba]